MNTQSVVPSYLGLLGLPRSTLTHCLSRTTHDHKLRGLQGWARYQTFYVMEGMLACSLSFVADMVMNLIISPEDGVRGLGIDTAVALRNSGCLLESELFTVGMGLPPLQFTQPVHPASLGTLPLLQE